MSSLLDLVLFDNDRIWLERQPGMLPWHEAQTRLVTQLNEWVTEYQLRLLGRTTVSLDDTRRDRYLARLWDCWRYHWQAMLEETPQRAVDGWQVAEIIRTGRSPARGARLGGDPLGDVVMAEAVLQQDEAARRKFHDGYRDFALGLAARVSVHLAGDETWWSDLVSKLAGDIKPPGKLASYTGKCGLQNWLGTVVRREALNTVRASRASAIDPSTPGRDVSSHRFANQIQGYSAVDGINLELPEDALMSRECRELFIRLFADAIMSLPAAERLLLVMMLVEQRSGKEVAALLGIHPGNVTRRKTAALESLQMQLAKSGSCTPSYQPCLEHLLLGTDRIDFGHLLAAALSSTVKESVAV